MTTTASKAPLIRLLVKRNYAAAAKPAVTSRSDIQLTTLPNKLVVASSEGVIPGVSQVSVAFRAGSRYEKNDNLGASHVLRCSAGLSTENATQFKITRTLQHMGARLFATSDRETIVYTLQSTSNHIDEALNVLKTVCKDQVFKPWELSDNVQRIKYELNIVPPQAYLIDLLHKAAYRNGLGNSIFVEDYNIKRMSSETLQHFVSENFLSNKCSVSGTGVSHVVLTDFANSLDLSTGQGNGGGSVFNVGEMRVDANTPETHIMIAGEAPSLQKKEVYTYAVLAQALGGSPNVKYGCGVSPLSKGLSDLPQASVGVVAVPHSDSGLLGVIVSAPHHLIAKGVEGVMKVLKGNLSDEDVERGKAKLVNQILDSGDNYHQEMAYQSVLIGCVSTPDAMAQAVQQVTPQQVQSALSKCFNGKKAMAALGSLYDAPYLDQI